MDIRKGGVSYPPWFLVCIDLLVTWLILLSWEYGIIGKTFVQNKISVVFKEITCQISEVYVKFKMADWWHFFVSFGHASEKPCMECRYQYQLNERFREINIKCVYTQKIWACCYSWQNVEILHKKLPTSGQRRLLWRLFSSFNIKCHVRPPPWFRNQTCLLDYWSGVLSVMNVIMWKNHIVSPLIKSTCS